MGGAFHIHPGQMQMAGVHATIIPVDQILCFDII